MRSEQVAACRFLLETEFREDQLRRGARKTLYQIDGDVLIASVNGWVSVRGIILLVRSPVRSRRAGGGRQAGAGRRPYLAMTPLPQTHSTVTLNANAASASVV